MTPVAPRWVAHSLQHGHAPGRDLSDRDEMIRRFLRLAYSVANRYARPGVDRADLEQVAMIGLVKAVDRYDPNAGYSFTSFAVPTIHGEIRSYLRDRTWGVHVPRSLKELFLRLRRALAELEGRLGRTPTTAELAAHTGTDEERVQEALAVGEVEHPVSLCSLATGTGAEGPIYLEDALGAPDAELRNVEFRVSLAQALRSLRLEQQQVIRLRYLQALSQRDVARQLGVSQMQVSRMERGALDQLRRQFAPA